MDKFRKKPVVIEAVKLEHSMPSIRDAMEFIGSYKWCDGRIEQEMYYDFICEAMKKDGLTIRTLEGYMLASWGDWIIKGVKNEFYPCKPDIFEATYERVDD